MYISNVYLKDMQTCRSLKIIFRKWKNLLRKKLINNLCKLKILYKALIVYLYLSNKIPNHFFFIYLDKHYYEKFNF